MTYLLKITDNAGTLSVDMSAMNPSFTFNFSNPIITIPTPMDEAAPIDAKSKWNVVTMNLNMNTQTINIVFEETSGITVLGSPINWATPTTVFEKLLTMATDPDKKKLYVNDDSAEFCLCEIKGYNVTVDTGRKDLLKHSLTLVIAANM